MTRLTVSLAGDSLTFRPITSSITRNSKDGLMDVIIMLFGTHYNINMNGILQQDMEGDIEINTESIDVNNGFLELKAELKSAGVSTAKLIGTFSSFTYFYPGLSIKGHLKLSETTHATPVPEFEGHIHLTDLLSKDALFFRLIRDELNLRFEVVEIVDAVENIIYTEALAALVDEYFFEFVYLKDGRSKFYKFADYETATQTKTRKWIGDLKAKVGECNVATHIHNAEEDLKTVSSDFVFLGYPQIFVKYDRTSAERLLGRVKMFDDMNDPVEANWKQIRSRDYKFTGNRVIENGMIRVVLNTVDPNMEIWGWNYNTVDAWEKVMTVIVDSDTDITSLKIQNIVFEYFSFEQIKCDVNFGTSVYSFIMSRGDPYITMLNKQKLKFKFESGKDRFAGDFKDRHNGYTFKNTDESGSPITKKATGTATCASVIATDTITVNGLVYTAVAGVKSDNTEFSIDTGDNECATDLADSISNDLRVGTDDVDIRTSGIAATNVVTITAEAGGVSGNSITLSQTGGTITLSGANLTGGATTGGTGTETLINFSMNDNWFSVYNTGALNEVVGWFSNIVKPTEIQINDLTTKLEYIFTYPIPGGIFGVGVLPTFPSNLVNDIPFPFVISTQDEYVKWRANESVLSFKELETIKKR